MIIESLRIRNFRCFGEPQPDDIISFDRNLTAFVGANGSGKTSLLNALQRLFGTRSDDRRLTREDVHFGPDEEPGPQLATMGQTELESDDQQATKVIHTREMEIEVTLAFPELDANAEDINSAVPEVFRAMSCAGLGEPLKARIRLEATWTYGVDEDDISSRIYWITSLSDVPFGPDDISKVPVTSGDLRRFQFRYLPATRDSAAIVRQALRELLTWLERSGDWQLGRAPMESQWRELQDLFDSMPAMKAVSTELGTNWNQLFDGHHLRSPRLTVIAREIQRALRDLSLVLGPGPDGRHRSVHELSEGQASLFYIAIIVTLMRLDSEIAKNPKDGFKAARGLRPWVTIIALEEPENHLAPFYLSRMIRLMRTISSDMQAMGIITTHSPAALRRVEPTQIRYVRQASSHLTSCAKPIPLPTELSDRAKFIQEAVQAHPELYFARLVILGEGRSEEVVLPRLARAVFPDVELDPAFVAFVPLGGRHVNHFWRLLNGLQIPYVTLLDYDLGRTNAGNLRLKYAADQLEALGRELPGLIRPNDAEGWRALAPDQVNEWMARLREENIYFSAPLDLDMMMLMAFPEAYAKFSEATKDDADSDCLKSVFGKGPALDAYKSALSQPSSIDLARYDDLFKRGSKPVAHMQALTQLSTEELATNCPEPLRALLERCSGLLPRQPNRLPNAHQFGLGQ